MGQKMILMQTSILRNESVQHIHIGCDFDTAWAYLTDPLNQAEWGIHFFREIMQEDNQYMAVLPFGKLPMRLVADRESGCIDLFLGDGQPTHMRLVKSSETSCLFVFILFQPTGMPDEVWQSEGIPNLTEELALLKHILEAMA